MNIEVAILDGIEIDPASGCWVWMGPVDKGGYARCGSVWRIHRNAYEIWVGPIPDGLTIDHTCHNADETCPGGICIHRRCLNPGHMEPTPNAVNVMRGKGLFAEHARKTHCPRDHPYDESNTYVHHNRNGRPNRRCRQCAADLQRANREQINERARARRATDPDWAEKHRQAVRASRARRLAAA